MGEFKVTKKTNCDAFINCFIDFENEVRIIIYRQKCWLLVSIIWLSIQKFKIKSTTITNSRGEAKNWYYTSIKQFNFWIKFK